MKVYQWVGPYGSPKAREVQTKMINGFLPAEDLNSIERSAQVLVR